MNIVPCKDTNLQNFGNVYKHFDHNCTPLRILYYTLNFRLMFILTSGLKT